ncbi:MAG: nucleotidyltransferase domain-containing protein [Sphingobacteriales bacterium]|nr:MAG: nucleotidyltransferase domain-containing protein [Sphingobacteriales bacterium]
MILNKDYIKQVVADYFKDKPVNKVHLFGSYATGKANEDSDIDLAFSILPNTKISYFKLAGYLVDLEERLNKKVDLVEIEMFFPRIKKKYESEKIELI